MDSQQRRRIEKSAEGIPLVFGDGKYEQDPPRPATAFEVQLAELLRGFVKAEDQPCRFDHNGDCQEHGWFGDEAGVPVACGVREAREILGL